VVITNPTHYAIALEYHQETMPDGPMLTAKGVDEVAARIRKLATEHGVPIVENKPLAQALYKDIEVGSFIPDTYYRVIAEIYKKVMHINELRRKAKASAETASVQTAYNDTVSDVEASDAEASGEDARPQGGAA
jgi:flagellar biosynthetic protein FlhB